MTMIRTKKINFLLNSYDHDNDNWDAAVDEKTGHFSFGMVVCDFKDAVVTARSTTKNFLVAYVVVEALTAYHAVEFYNEMGFC